MNKNLTTTVLLIIVAVTDAYLLSHPNLIGKIGIFIYKHDYIKTFPRALVTVMLVIGVSIGLCEIVKRAASPKIVWLWYLAFLVLGIALYSYVYLSFSSFSYSMTGKAFIYGAHLLPIILVGLFGRYLVKALITTRNTP